MSLSICLRQGHLKLFPYNPMLLRSLILLVFLGTNTLAFSQSKPDLSVVSHIEGHWKGEFSGGPIEGSWSAPEGSNIVGYLRMIRNNKPHLYEIFVFEQTENGPVARVKHFTPGLISVEEKEAADTYQFIESSKNKALFERSDKKVRIIYELRKPDQLIIQRGTPASSGGWEFVDLFDFQRVK